MTQQRRVLDYLKKFGSITSLEIANKFYVTAPHSVIRDLRKTLGNDAITDLWQQSKRTEILDNGDVREVTIRYKRYFLEKFEDIA